METITELQKLSFFEPVECHCWRAWQEHGQSSPTGAEEEEDLRLAPHIVDPHPDEKDKFCLD